MGHCVSAERVGGQGDGGRGGDMISTGECVATDVLMKR